jgi:hypothetical protein
VKSARDGSTIVLREGLYRIAQPLEINKSINFVAKSGAGFNKTVIESTGNYCLDFGFGQPAFTGIKFRHEAAGYCVRVRNEATPQFAKCAIEAPRGNGLLVTGRDANPTFKGCRINNCNTFCVRVENSARGTFDDCEIFGAPAPAELYLLSTQVPIL